jgi:hypothetical protein
MSIMASDKDAVETSAVDNDAENSATENIFQLHYIDRTKFTLRMFNSSEIGNVYSKVRSLIVDIGAMNEKYNLFTLVHCIVSRNVPYLFEPCIKTVFPCIIECYGSWITHGPIFFMLSPWGWGGEGGWGPYLNILRQKEH